MTASPPHIPTDLTAGLLFAALGAGFAGAALLGLPLGNAFRMGPGYFPAIIGGLLCGLGLVIAVKGWRERAVAGAAPPIPWRAVVLIPTGLMMFGFAMRPLGLGPALLLVSLMAGLAVEGLKPAHAVLLAVAVTALAIAIFNLGLGINLPLLGNWLR